MMSYRLLQISRPISPNTIKVDIGKIILCHCPFFWESLTGKYLQGLLIMSYRLLQISRPLLQNTAAIGRGKIVLCHRPILWERLLGKNLKGHLVANNGNFQIVGTATQRELLDERT